MTGITTERAVDVVERIIQTVIAPNAWLARSGRYPRTAIGAFGRTGLLGLTVGAEAGGLGHGLPEAVDTVRRVASACPAIATVLARHYAATAVLEAHAPQHVRAEIAAGRHLSTLALDDVGGERWSGGGTAEIRGYAAQVYSCKRCVISAGEADSYIWSTRARTVTGGLTLWLVPGAAPGLYIAAEPHAVGPPGSGCADILADPALIPSTATLGADGTGATILARTAAPWLLALSEAVEQGWRRS
ncbi:acyl-CoA dehydrogenase family protein [Nocardia crassostreae]|uniref:acyl-CoA dehydrogenase family protein n=1 Tax=Nocardia crassostreae TaxID=53428 RepID=UPI0008304FB7|nr:acyl-CoA dehydrogenase family protein [Nocardia crassostreae]